MRAKVVLKLRQSLDGYICSPTGNDGFLFGQIDEEALDWETDYLWRAGVHVMGRTLYEQMAAYWPQSKLAPAAAMNDLPKAVISRTLKAVTWGPAHILRAGLTEEIVLLRDQHTEEVLVHGGVRLAQAMVAANLVDEFRILVHPVTLGAGQPGFASAHQLQLRETHTFKSGVVALFYVRPQVT